MGKAKKKIKKKKDKAAQTKSGLATVTTNRRARFDYKLGDDVIAGIVLTGTEVKSLRNCQASLSGAYVKVIKGEAFLLNCNIPEYKFGNRNNHKPMRERKLLLNRKEIEWLEYEVNAKNRSLVPTKIFFKGNYAKLKLAVAEGKKKSDKRTDLKKKAQNREIDQAMKKYAR